MINRIEVLPRPEMIGPAAASEGGGLVDARAGAPGVQGGVCVRQSGCQRSGEAVADRVLPPVIAGLDRQSIFATRMPHRGTYHSFIAE